jgi:hypothetical protein
VGEPSLPEALHIQADIATVHDLERANFETSFKSAIPRALVATLIPEEWYIDAESGLLAYEFTRTPLGVAPYRMFHLFMDVNGHKPG